MTLLWVELSGENLELADAELSAVVCAVGGTLGSPPELLASDRVRAAEIPSASLGPVLADRLALARRVFRPLGTPEDPSARSDLARLGRAGRRIRFRIRHAEVNSGWREPVEVFREAGGTVDLETESSALHLWPDRNGRWWLLEEVGPVDRTAYERRRPSRLPFRRPVTLPPRLGRVIVNLAGVRAGEHVIDPFLGTGALLAEAALVGARVGGMDHDAAMVRGALKNFAFLEVVPEELRVADATEAWRPSSGGTWDALITDPPYGRASPSGPESAGALVSRVVQAWSPLLGRRARVAFAVPHDAEVRLPDWCVERRVPHRAHRSLTREFRVYARRAARRSRQLD